MCIGFFVNSVHCIVLLFRVRYFGFSDSFALLHPVSRLHVDCFMSRYDTNCPRPILTDDNSTFFPKCHLTRSIWSLPQIDWLRALFYW